MIVSRNSFPYFRCFQESDHGEPEVPDQSTEPGGYRLLHPVQEPRAEADPTAMGGVRRLLLGRMRLVVPKALPKSVRRRSRQFRTGVGGARLLR